MIAPVIKDYCTYVIRNGFQYPCAVFFTRSVAVNMLMLFALTLLGDTSADAFGRGVLSSENAILQPFAIICVLRETRKNSMVSEIVLILFINPTDEKSQKDKKSSVDL